MNATEEHHLKQALWGVVQQRPQCVLLETGSQWDAIPLDTHPIRNGCGARIIPWDDDDDIDFYILAIAKWIRDSTRPQELIFMRCMFEPDVEGVDGTILWTIEWRSPGPPVVQNNNN
jgi:hypothetical protein